MGEYAQGNACICPTCNRLSTVCQCVSPDREIGDDFDNAPESYKRGWLEATSSAQIDIADLKRRLEGYEKECADVDQILGKALGYPWYIDDQQNFPGATEADGVCTGEHTPASLALEAARRLEEAEDTIERMEKLGEQLADAWVVELDCEVSEVETVTVVLCRSCQRYVKDRDGRDTSHADDCIVAAWRESRVTRVEE